MTDNEISVGHILRDALKVSEMRMAHKKVAKELGVPVFQLTNFDYILH